jgi:hypothetical protein
MFNTISNRFEPITFKATAFTPVYEQPITPIGGSHIGSVYNPWENVVSFAYKLQSGQNVTGGEVICGVNWYLGLETGGDPNGDGQYTLTVYEDTNGYPGTEIAKAVCELGSPEMQSQGTFKGREYFAMRFYFDKLIQIPIDGAIFVGITRSDEDGNLVRIQDDGAIGGGGLPLFEKYVITEDADTDINAATKEFQRVILDQGKDHFDVWGLSVSHDLSGGNSANYQNGLGHVEMTISMRDQGAIPDIERERFIINSKGLRDISGAVTGSAGALIASPIWTIQTLLHEWNGSTWVNDRISGAFSDTWDAVNSSASPLYVVLRGSTQGRITAVNLIKEIAYNSACMIVPVSDGKIATYFMGTDRPAFASLEEDLFRMTAVDIRGSDSIVNNFRSVYNRIIVQRQESLLAEGGLQSYNASFDSKFDTVLVDPDLIALSKARFGDLELDVNQFNFIGSEASMRSLASIYLQTYTLPSLFVTLDVPYSVFSSVELLSKFDLYSSVLPHEQGTTQDAQLPVNDDLENPVEIINGHYFKRQQKYTFIVLGKTVTLGKNEQPTIVLNCMRVNKGASL